MKPIFSHILRNNFLGLSCKMTCYTVIFAYLRKLCSVMFDFCAHRANSMLCSLVHGEFVMRPSQQGFIVPCELMSFKRLSLCRDKLYSLPSFRESSSH